MNIFVCITVPTHIFCFTFTLKLENERSVNFQTLIRTPFKYDSPEEHFMAVIAIYSDAKIRNTSVVSFAIHISITSIAVFGNFANTGHGLGQ